MCIGKSLNISDLESVTAYTYSNKSHYSTLMICAIFIQGYILTYYYPLLAFDLSQDQPRESSVPVVDGRVDWSQTFAGIEQPNEAYSLVKQSQHNQQPQHPAVSGLESGETVTEGPHEYEDVLPPSDVSKQRQTNQQTVDEQMDCRVDWSQTFAGMEPNSLVMKKNKAYEIVNEQSRQRRQLANQQPHHSATSQLVSEGVTELEEPHEYEEIRP